MKPQTCAQPDDVVVDNFVGYNFVVVNVFAIIIDNDVVVVVARYEKGVITLLKRSGMEYSLRLS